MYVEICIERKNGRDFPGAGEKVSSKDLITKLKMTKRLLFHINGKILRNHFKSRDQTKVLFYVQAKAVEEQSNQFDDMDVFDYS